MAPPAPLGRPMESPRFAGRRHPELAECRGFEPWNAFALSCLRDRRNQPLCHHSLKWRTGRDSNARKAFPPSLA
jgi:hypothetical protein